MKRLAALLLCLLLLPGALAEAYVVNYTPPDGPDYVTCSMLLRDDGTVLVGPDACASLYELTPPDAPEAERRFSAASLQEFAMDAYGCPEPLCAMLDAEGRQLTDFEFTYIYRDYDTGLPTFGRANNDMGILRPDGSVAVEGPYNPILPWGDGWLVLKVLRDSSNALCRIDADGAVTDTGLRANTLRLPKTESDPIVLEDKGGDYCVDADLRPCFEGKMTSIESFQDGLAVARPAGSDLYGLIDAAGRFVLPAKYANVYRFAWNDRALILALDAHERGYAVLDPAMNLLSHVDLTPIARDSDVSAYPGDSGLIDVYLNDRDNRSVHMTFDPWGRPIPQTDDYYLDTYYIRAEGEPQRAVRVAPGVPQLCCIVDPEGNRCSQDFQSLDPALWKDGHGRFISSVYRLSADENDLGIDWNSRRMGVVDENGAEVLPPVYNDLAVLDLDRFWVTEGTRIGMIDGEGRWYYVIDAYASLLD